MDKASSAPFAMSAVVDIIRSVHSQVRVSAGSIRHSSPSMKIPSFEVAFIGLLKVNLASVPHPFLYFKYVLGYLFPVF